MPDNHLTVIPSNGVETYRASTDAASISKAIVIKTAMEIQGRKYVKVEGWQAIAVAHGCTASSGSVGRVEGGFRAVGQVRRMDTGAVIAEAEGFVGEDEPVWFGGEGFAYGKPKTFSKRADYAIRAMAQTRAISRACRSAFAHVVVMMDAGLQTTPAEEVPDGGFDDAPAERHQPGAAGSAAGGSHFRPERRQQSTETNQTAAIVLARQDIASGQNGTTSEKKAPSANSTAKKLTPDQRATKIKDGVDKRVGILKSMNNWTRPTLDQVWKDNEDWISWMSDPANEALDQYERFSNAYAEAELNIREIA